MKLASIPEVRVDAINAGLKSFFSRHSLPVIQLVGARRKRLLRAFQLDNEFRSARGYAPNTNNSLTLVWHRYGGGESELGTHCEFNVWTTADDLLSKNLDAISASGIRDCRYFKLRVWVGGVQKYFLFNLRKGR
jgi:hypothetical protein